MLCTRARDHGICGVGIDMSQLFSEQATQHAAQLGVGEQVSFIHDDAAGYIADEKSISPPALVQPDCGWRRRNGRSASKEP